MQDKKKKRSTAYLYILLAFVQAGLTSGIIFGWPSLEATFIEEKVYRDHCKSLEKTPCEEQTLFFELIYTVAIFTNNAAPLVTGIFLDKFGPKKTNLVSIALFFLGCGLFAVPSALIKIPAFALLGFAGPGVYCSIMHLCNLFPGHQSAVLSFFSGTFSASSFIFKVFSIIHDSHNKFLTMPALFIEYILILAPLFLFGAFIWPNKPFDPPGQHSHTDDVERVPLVDPTEKIQLTKLKSLYNASPLNQFKSLRYWVPVIWIALLNLNASAYIGTVSTRFPDSSLPSAFNLTWSLGWVAIPFFGVILDRAGITFSMLVTSIGFLIFSILKLIPVHDVQYLTFIMISATNVGMWGIFYSYLSAKFGFDNYGKLLGVMCITVAVIGLLQYPMATITLKRLHSNFVYVDSIFVVTSVLTFICPIYLWYIERPVQLDTYQINS